MSALGQTLCCVHLHKEPIRLDCKSRTRKFRGFPGGASGKDPAPMQETGVQKCVCVCQCMGARVCRRYVMNVSF